jgi:2,3-bisphosphoglycerate-independent phosphoglycerate mutase
MLFLDGVGIGKKDPDVNPFLEARLPALRSLFSGDFPTLRHRRLTSHQAITFPLDATFGIPGLPQSGTGQTALFTGVNGPKLAGKHFGPHPYSTLKPVIEEKNIFRRLLQAGKRPCFANAFPQRFFDYVEQQRSRLTVTTLSCLYAGLPLLRADDLRAGRGVSADITNIGWRQLGYPDIAPIEPAEAGRRLVRLTADHDFVLFEYWKTDHAGHSQNMNEAVYVLEVFDSMLLGVIEELDTRSTLLIITSDHGNIEDLSTKSHTRNPVPVILFGHRHQEVSRSLRGNGRRPSNLGRVTPTLLRFLLPHS